MTDETLAGPATRRFSVPHGPEEAAAKARRWGAFYYMEHVLRVMKGYSWSLLMYSVGHPVAYLFAMGVGLATLVDAQGGGAFGGVGYVTWRPHCWSRRR
ncbi:hypothetical protein ARTHRO9AX_80334 [Arthrobacter sp. 9AX]|nr:hypothetical protein ARTHRO9AX_80334 [Arthrobacter sp. 9AX]